MKKIVNKLRYTLLLGFIALATLGNSLNAATLDVCNGTNTYAQIPLYGTYFDDNYQLSQMIYPESMLTNMVGGKIKSLTFYTNSASNLSSLTGGKFDIRVGMTSTSQYGSTPSRITSGMVLVASNKVLSQCVSGANVVINFDTEFTYTGGNLVIEYNSTQLGTAFKSVSFYGYNQNNGISQYASYIARSTTTSSPTGGSRQRFLPHVTFGYEVPAAHDLGIALSAPASVGAGNAVTLTATVTNNGTNAESGYTVTFRDGNNNVIDTQTGGSLAAGANTTFTTTYTTTAAQAGQTINFTATVKCTGDADASNNTATASTSVIILPPPENVVATASDNQTATVTWDPPIISATTYTWDFETSSQVNDWTLVDSDGDGYNWQLAPYNTSGSQWEPHGGTGDMASASFINDIGALTPDNWMISPEVTLGGTFTFWAKGTDATYYAEKFGVFVYQGSYSSGTSGFVQVDVDKTATDGWLQYSFDLSQYSGQGRIAIRHYDCTDKYWLLVDDIEYNEPSLHLVSYNVYLDGVLQGNVSSSDPRSYTFNNLSSGTHVCSVSAVYTEGESAQIPANIPSFEPVTSGTVTPNSVDFGTQNIGGTYTATVTVTNTGNQSFTPTIDATGLPQGISVSPTTSGTVAPNGTLDLTVTFTPTAEQSYSGTFTVTIPVPDDDDIVVTVTVTGAGYYGNRLTSNTTDEIPVYKSEAQADGTFIFLKDDVDDDEDMSLSYDTGGAAVQVLVKDDAPIVRYDLHHKEGSDNWTYPNGTAVATATQDANNPKIYTVDQETFTIPSDATQMWLPMTDEGVDATDIYFVPVTVANGIVTQGNTYGAPQVQPVTITLTPQYVNIGGSKSAGRPGGHWTMTIDGNEVDYCVYTPVVTVRPATPTNAVPYLVRAWLLENENVPFYSIKRVPNENDPSNTHIEADEELTYPKLLGQQELNAEMIGGDLHIGYDWNESQSPSPWGDVFPENIFAAPSDMSGENITIAARVYYYRLPENSNSRSLRADGDEAPEDGYGYGEGEGEGNGIPTAVSSIFTDRQVVDVKYVNTIGMQSDKPFDGVNIVVTRYSDGSITTTKVLK